VQDILALGKEHTEATLPGMWSASWRKNEIWFERERESGSDYEYPLPVPGEVKLREARMVIHARFVTVHAAGQDGAVLRPTQATFMVRNWRAGDRFWPQGRKEPKKIKELLQERQITGEEKKLWPVVVAGDEVVWVRAFGVRRDWLAKTGEGVLISESQLPPGD
jgi:tRNA(Ile)-lysidine synthetase-like protein